MMHTHLYRNSSHSFWSEDEEEENEVERWNNNDAVLWQAPPPYYNATLGPPMAPPPPYCDYTKARHNNHTPNNSFWRKLFSSRMWKQCWGYPQPRSRGRSSRTDEYHYPNQLRQQLSKLLVHPQHGGVSPTCSISSSYPQSSVSGDEEEVDDDASSVSSQSLSDEEDCRILLGSHPKENGNDDPRASFVSIPLPPSGSPRRRRGPPVRNVVRRTSRADSVSSANSRHRREKALLPPITDIYFNTITQQHPDGMQRVVSALPMDDDDDSLAHQEMHPTDLPPELQPDDEDDDVLFHLSSSSASSGRPQRGKPRLAAPEDWMLEWAGSGEQKQQPAEEEEEDPIPIPPHPVLFTAGWAVMHEHTAGAAASVEQQPATKASSASTDGCVHVVLIEQTNAPCLWFTPKDGEGRAIPCAPWDVTSGQDCVWIRSHHLSLQPLSTQHHDTLLFWRMGLDAALRHNHQALTS